MTVDRNGVGDPHVAASPVRRRQTGQPLDRREAIERSRVDRCHAVEMHDTMRCVDVLGDLDLANPVDAERAHRLHEAVEHIGGRRQQLACLPRGAHIVGAFAKEPGQRTADVEPRPHPIPLLRRRRDRYGGWQFHASDARECVDDHERLDLDLPRIRDVRVEAAAAEQINGSRSPVG